MILNFPSSLTIHNKCINVLPKTSAFEANITSFMDVERQAEEFYLQYKRNKIIDTCKENISFDIITKVYSSLSGTLTNSC